jgi:hypothetical protein
LEGSRDIHNIFRLFTGTLSMGNRKILAVSYAFPPMAYPRSIQVSRLLSSLSGYVKVICASSFAERNDESIFFGVAQVFPDILRVDFKRNPLDRLFKYIVPGYGPDEYVRWVERASDEFADSGSRTAYKPDLLITFGMPMSDHLFGLMYKKSNSTPWIAHFSDPWSDNPYLEHNLMQRRFSRKWERAVIEGCDAAVFTSPETVDLVMRKYPASWRKKAFCVPHSYDLQRYDKELRPPEAGYVIRHIGSFYGKRSPETFFKALESICLEQPALLSGVSIDFVGFIGKYRNMLAGYPHARNVIKSSNSVPYVESLRLMQTAHCLLVCDAPRDYSVFFPSKLADYLGAKRFIVAISPKGAAQRIVQEAGGWVADPNDIGNIKGMLIKLLKEKPNAITGDISGYEHFHVAGIMESIIESVCAGRL